MRNQTDTTSEILEELVTKWLPITADRHDLSRKSKLIVLGLKAIAEELKLIRDDMRTSVRRGNRTEPQGGRDE